MRKDKIFFIIRNIYTVLPSETSSDKWSSLSRVFIFVSVFAFVSVFVFAVVIVIAFVFVLIIVT